MNLKGDEVSEKKAGLAKAPTERSKLDAWFSKHRVKKGDAALVLGISRSRLNQLLSGIFLSPEWRSRLIFEIGIPDDLLPVAKEE